MENSKEDEEGSGRGDAVTNDKPSTSTVGDVTGNQSHAEAGGDVGGIDPVPCPEPKSGAIVSTLFVTAAKSKHQIEEEEREKMQ